jgi:aldose sugar dehydrogenase
LGINEVQRLSYISLLFIILDLSFVTIGYHYYLFKFATAQRGVTGGREEEGDKLDDDLLPIINKSNLTVEQVFKGLKFPTSMAFLGPNDILVLEKNNGTVQRIVNGKSLAKPLLNVPVANEGERGMLGIAVAKNLTRHTTYVFVYYTQSGGGKIGDDATAGIQPLGDRLYRYELNNNDDYNNSKLTNPKLLLNIPTSPKTPNHNGGKMVIGPDQNVYLVVGDVDKFYNLYFDHLPLATEAQNIQNGKDPDGAGGILRLTQDGKPVLQNNIFNSSKYPLSLYYAYGIRNSFGLAFDPITGMLWDTENGPDYGDEINLVQPGFNSGWGKVQGIWYNNGSHEGPVAYNVSDLNNILVNIEGKGKYRSPEFIWNETVAPTGIAFLNSNKLGKQYENNMFVGDFKNGELYDFKLNSSRTGLILKGTLTNKISNTVKDSQPLIFASGFKGGITDVKVNPYDGNMYILTAAGFIYRITSSSSSSY